MKGLLLTPILLLLALVIAPAARAVDVIDRTRPLSLDPLQATTVAPRIIVNTPDPVAHPIDEMDSEFAKLLKAGDCSAILKAVPSHDFETAKPELLAVAASCEPPGKDPEKMFFYAESKAPTDDIILLLHARYAWKKKNPIAEQLFTKLYARATDLRIKELAGQYIAAPAESQSDHRDQTSYVVAGQIGGVEQANPLGVAISDASFGTSASTGGTAQLALTARKPREEYSFGVDYIANNTTYWATHAADLLTQDMDVTAERRLGDSLSIGLRPYGSFYLLQGTRYYALEGVGLTLRSNAVAADSWLEQWLQFSFYQDKFYSSDATAESGSHNRVDWQGNLRHLSAFSPVFLAYVDHANSGVDVTGGNYIPYSHNEYGAALSMSRPLHRYSVSLLLRIAFREDSEETRLYNVFGDTVKKQRRDFQVVIQPSLTVPLKPGLDLYMYFSSNSISSSLIASDGLDRNISDNLVAASLRFSFTNF